MDALTQAELLEVWRRVTDPSYSVPLEEATGADAAGFDAIQSIVATLVRASQAVEVTTQAMYVYPHSEQSQPPGSAGAQATGTIAITRAAPTDGDINIEEGDELVVRLVGPDGQTVDVVTLEIAADVTVPNGSSGPVAAAVRAVRDGYQGNIADSRGVSLVFHERTTMTATAIKSSGNTITTTATSTGDIDFDEGMIGAFVRFTAGPNTGLGPRRITDVDVTLNELDLDGASLTASLAGNEIEIIDLNEVGLSAELTSVVSGGVAPWLDHLGRERGIGRGIDESDASFRERIRALPDVVSPNAIYRAVSRILTPLGVPFRVLESRSPRDFDGAAWDLSPYDDTGADYLTPGRQHYWQGNGFQYRGFYVFVERQWYGDFGICWDYEPGVGGVHPFAAWDWGACDGYPLGFYNDLARMVAEVEKTRMAGVPWLVVLVDSIP